MSSINFQKIDKISDKLLSDVKILNSINNIQLVRDKIGFEVAQIAIISKCNAVSIIVAYFGEYETSYVKARLLSAWDEIAPIGLSGAYRYIKSYEDNGALKYLAECAIGLNSITTGDSQVLSQICGALMDADSFQHDGFRLFPIISDHIRKLAKTVKLKTSLYNGNISLERVAAEIVSNSKPESDKSVSVIGVGRTGELIVKILSSEYGINVVISNRSTEKLKIILKKYPKVSVVDLNDIEKIIKKNYIVIALSNTQDTKKYAKELMDSIKGPTTVIDLSSPSITNSLNILERENIINIENLSKISDDRLNNRKSDIDKVHLIIQFDIKDLIVKINKSAAEYCLDCRKRSISAKLDNHSLNLLRVRSNCNKAIRNNLEKKKFIEITTPYIVGVSSDPPKVDNGGVFSVDWPDGGTAFLRQSNQLYKQMVVASGIDKMFEIGPFWRAEKSTSCRHLLEAIGLDVEFANPDSLRAVYELAYDIIVVAEKSIVKTANLEKSILYLPPVSEVPVLTYSECIELLRHKGHDVKYGQDLGLIGESLLGQTIKKERNSDALIIINYPDTVKKFYTMKKEDGETETFDIIVGGWELVSGALRNTNREQIEKSMMLSGVNVLEYSFYLSVISDAVKHGGFCLGLDRVIAKSMGVDIVSQTSPFPRTAESLIP